MSSSRDGISVGFTGSRNSASIRQYVSLKKVLSLYDPVEAHHGSCVGADSQFHGVIRQYYPQCRIVIHPPINTKLMQCLQLDCEEWLTPKEYLERDRDIVDACDVLIGCPNTKVPYRGSGTWYTINYAKQIVRKTIVILPDGSWE